MFASALVFTGCTLGLTWIMSILAGVVALAWPPTVWSLGQFTPIWLLGLVLAYKFRGRPLASGVYIAIASLPKFLAIPSLLYHLRRRRWSVLIGFAAIWFTALAVLLVLRPDSIANYIESNTGNSIGQILRPNNSALAIVAWRFGGGWE